MDPEQGRFIARDTIGAWGDANNLGNPFAYVGNNPWSGLDPYGRSGDGSIMGHLLTGNRNPSMEELGAALGEMRRPVNRSTGLVTTAVGAAEFGGGFTLASGGTAATGTGVGAIPGIPALVAGSVFMTHGVDVMSTGWNQFLTGEIQQTQTYQAVLAATGSETAALYVDAGLSMIGPAPAAARAGGYMLGDVTLDAAQAASQTGRVAARYGSAEQRLALLNRVKEASSLQEAKGVVYAFREMKRLGYELQDASLHYRGNQGLDLVFSNGTRNAVVEAKHGASLALLKSDMNGMRQGSLAYNINRLDRYLKLGSGTHNALVGRLIAEGQAGQLESFASLYGSRRVLELPTGWPTIPAIRR